MDYSFDQAIKSFPGVRIMLDSLPRDIWDIFLPKSYEKLALLETNILSFVSRAAERERVMGVQSLCGFPLRPNASLSETLAKARLQGHQSSKLLDSYKRKRRDDISEDDNTIPPW